MGLIVPTIVEDETAHTNLGQQQNSQLNATAGHAVVVLKHLVCGEGRECVLLLRLQPKAKDCVAWNCVVVLEATLEDSRVSVTRDQGGVWAMTVQLVRERRRICNSP
jgi:hypothetical protein